MKKLIVVIAMCLPLAVSASMVWPICTNRFNINRPCPQLFETTGEDITQEQALEIAVQTIALVWERSIPEDFDDVSAWLASCEYISAEFSERNDIWIVSYIFDELTQTIEVEILQDGRVNDITVFPCALNYCLD